MHAFKVSLQFIKSFKTAIEKSPKLQLDFVKSIGSYTQINRKNYGQITFQNSLDIKSVHTFQRRGLSTKPYEVDVLSKSQREAEKYPPKTNEQPVGKSSSTINAIPNPKSKQKLSETSKQRKVPSSRVARMVSFGTLAAGLGLGTAAEYAKRSLFSKNPGTDNSNVFFNEANMDRIVDTLCKVRGAALKIGQILSIQDESIVDPEITKAFERVRKSADFMPDWQLQEVMKTELGPNWRDNFDTFDSIPFAAASIGQVHYGKLKNGSEVAVKVQYPGVARGINSDIENLATILKVWNVFPKGMFLENLMAVTKRELAWEVDYNREADQTKKFRELLAPYEKYYVPNVFDNLSTEQVFTAELLHGLPLDECFEMDTFHREFIGERIMELFLLELFKFNRMQTDPNWANFLYDPDKNRLLLLDFGSSRSYSKEFIAQYVKLLNAARENNRRDVLSLSRELGFLTGYESKIMEEAHIDAFMTVGEIFRNEGRYNFEKQNVTARIKKLAETITNHRLCPPPEEIYSLHRKLFGLFWLFSKLKVSLPCSEMFATHYDQYLQEKD
ncbi:unnamed protein product [Phyllotreta striolata]|uniref:ABC1 atypical kinase-like domain-containing protein n=1 Tax=Phyllotreta striolata TaxID=444603 RepID=A0A9N9TS08_PHYSR|nr:unnamed protein product [Phyllotreta striolata]